MRISPNQVRDANTGSHLCCKTGLWGGLATIGICCVTPFLLGILGLAFLRSFVDTYVLLPLLAICVTVGLYGWINGGRIMKKSVDADRGESWFLFNLRYREIHQQKDHS
jgi:hypothetical protein